jgi:hypothetical protein
MTTLPLKNQELRFRTLSEAPGGWEKDEDWRINHREKLAIGCKPEMKS